MILVQKTPRRWFAFRLRTLFVVVAVLSAYMWLLSLPPIGKVVVCFGPPGSQTIAERRLWVDEAIVRTGAFAVILFVIICTVWSVAWFRRWRKT